jgi:hypothetical protein
MNARFFAGLLILGIACMAQFSFASTGVVIDFVFAALIAFAFVFDFWELFFFVVLSVFIMNWQPAPSVAIFAFAAIPVIAYLFRVVFPWELWIGVIISLILGLFLLYLIASPQFIVAEPSLFLLDLFWGFAFGFLIFASMNRTFAKK